MSIPIAVTQVMLIRRKETSPELTSALWAVLKEVESLYNHDKPRARFRRLTLSRHEIGSPLLRPFQLSRELRHALKQGTDAGTRSPDPLEKFFERVRGRYIGTVDQGSIADRVREAVGVPPDSGALHALLIVVDEELTPPEGYRYLIWETRPATRDAIVSIVPTDPNYWREEVSDRVAVIKERVRVACLSAVGELLGFERCDNPRCFLCEDVYSVAQLDDMVCIGPEHGEADLTEKGFPIRADHPEKPKPVEHVDTSHPIFARAWWYGA